MIDLPDGPHSAEVDHVAYSTGPDSQKTGLQRDACTSYAGGFTGFGLCFSRSREWAVSLR